MRSQKPVLVLNPVLNMLLHPMRTMLLHPVRTMLLHPMNTVLLHPVSTLVLLPLTTVVQHSLRTMVCIIMPSITHFPVVVRLSHRRWRHEVHMRWLLVVIFAVVRQNSSVVALAALIEVLNV
jgi:hypothetical protein